MRHGLQGIYWKAMCLFMYWDLFRLYSNGVHWDLRLEHICTIRYVETAETARWTDPLSQASRPKVTEISHTFLFISLLFLLHSLFPVSSLFSVSLPSSAALFSFFSFYPFLSLNLLFLLRSFSFLLLPLTSFSFPTLFFFFGVVLE